MIGTILFIIAFIFLLFTELYAGSYIYVKFGQYSVVFFIFLALAYDIYTVFKFVSALKSDKDNWLQNEVMILVPIVIIISPLLVNGVLYGIFNDPKLTWIKDRIVGDEHDWISFLGSIIGGTITMIALYYTIKHELDVHKKEKLEHLNESLYQSFPILEVKFISDVDNDANISVVSSPVSDLTDREFSVSLGISIKNISNYLARRLTINSLKLVRTEYDLELKKEELIVIKDLKEEATLSLQNPIIIPPGFSERIDFYFMYPANRYEFIKLVASLTYYDNTGLLVIGSLFEVEFTVQFSFNESDDGGITTVIWPEITDITDPVNRIVKVEVITQNELN